MKTALIIGFMVILTGIHLSGANGITAETGPHPKNKTENQSTVERLLMEGTEIKGTVEKPHVVYVVPWKPNSPVEREDILEQRSFMEEILEPIDRDRFIRDFRNFKDIKKGGQFK